MISYEDLIFCKGCGTIRHLSFENERCATCENMKDLTEIYSILIKQNKMQGKMIDNIGLLTDISADTIRDLK